MDPLLHNINSFSQYSKAIVNSSIGNILEWYDFGLFSIFSILFSHIFFPPSAGRFALIETLMVFGIGFFCRPLGALIFGYLGDTRGRAKTLRLSILMISLPTLAIGILPTYQQIGILAPISLLLIRMWQGISIGGEYSGNLIYLAETAPAKYRATYTSFACTGSNIGILLAALVGMAVISLFSEQLLQNWAWRLPYLLSGIFSLIFYFFRFKLKETQTFQQLQQNHQVTNNPIKVVFQEYLPQLFRIIGLVCMGSTFYYFCFLYLPIYIVQHKNIATKNASVMISVCIALMIFLVPIAGYLCDLIGRRKMLLFNAAFVIIFTISGFYFLQNYGFIFFLPVLLLFTVASSLEQGTTSVSVVENFSPRARYTGVSLGYNIGNGLFGGTVPMVCEWLIANTTISLAPAIYITLCAVLTGLTVFFFIPETKNISMVDVTY